MFKRKCQSRKSLYGIFMITTGSLVRHIYSLSHFRISKYVFLESMKDQEFDIFLKITDKYACAEGVAHFPITRSHSTCQSQPINPNLRAVSLRFAQVLWPPSDLDVEKYVPLLFSEVAK